MLLADIKTVASAVKPENDVIFMLFYLGRSFWGNRLLILSWEATKYADLIHEGYFVLWQQGTAKKHIPL